MRRPLSILVFVLFGCAAISVRGVSRALQGPNDAHENVLVKVAKPTAVPERFQTGFATITARDSREQEQSTMAPDSFAEVAFTAGVGLGEILYQANQAVGLDLWLKAEETAKSSGIVSDYLPFARAHVPYIYWEGPRHRDYHQTSDRPEMIDSERMAKIIRLAYLGMVALADR